MRLVVRELTAPFFWKRFKHNDNLNSLVNMSGYPGRIGPVGPTGTAGSVYFVPNNVVISSSTGVATSTNSSLLVPLLSTTISLTGPSSMVRLSATSIVQADGNGCYVTIFRGTENLAGGIPNGGLFQAGNLTSSTPSLPQTFSTYFIDSPATGSVDYTLLIRTALTGHPATLGIAGSLSTMIAEEI